MTSLFTALLWGFACIWLAVVAFLASQGLTYFLSLTGQAYGLGWSLATAWWAALPVIAVVGYWAWRRLGDRFWSSKGALWTGFGLLLATRLVAAVLIDVPLISDFLEYHRLAVSVTAGGPWFSELRPMGYPLMLAGAYKLLGPTTGVGEGLNLLLALGTGALVYGFARRVWSREGGAIALWLYALCPAQALVVTLMGTEVAYAAVFLAAMWAGTEAARGKWPPALLTGALLGLAQYIRPTSLALLPALLVLPFLLRQPWKRAMGAAFGMVVAFLLVLAPVAAYNHRVEGKWSLSTSNYGGWSVLVGTNQKHNGAWNVDDVALMAKYTDLREMNRAAQQEGVRRLTSDPAGFIALAGRKFPLMWAQEDYATYWTLGTGPKPDVKLTAPLMLLSQLFYAFVLVAALLALLLERRRRPAAGLLFGAVILTLTGIHSLMEVQSRYHFYVVPLLIVLAAGAFRPKEAAGRS
jgi:4-amino-4-deoxy-L-arabinose transferase-like glycosyltransferase